MQLSLLSIKTKLDGNYFYFAADNIYFDLYGKALVLSLLDRAPWAKIHIHFFNQTTSQQLWCNNKNITYTKTLAMWIVTQIGISIFGIINILRFV